MKQFKKIIICLLAVLALAGGQATYVSAATESEVSMLNTEVYVSKGGAGVNIIFDYVDGSNVYFIRYDILEGADSYQFTLTHNSFSNDKRTVIVTATNRYNGTKVTLGAWCDIYGETDTF